MKREGRGNWQTWADRVLGEEGGLGGKSGVSVGRKKGTGSQLHRWLSWVGQVTGDERRGVIGHVNDSDGFIWVITWCRPSQPERSWRLLWFWDTPLCHLGGWTEETGGNNKQRMINYEEKQTLQFCVTFSVILKWFKVFLSMARKFTLK